MTRIILGLGANLGDREAMLQQAVKHLAESILSDCKPSSILETPPLLPEGAPESWHIPYLNMAVSGNTSLTLHQLHDATLSLEEQLGRSANSMRWSPRIIDIDILAYGEEHLTEDSLHVPHKELLKRGFALAPFAELWPEWQYPVKGPHFRKTAASLLKELENNHENA